MFLEVGTDKGAVLPLDNHQLYSRSAGRAEPEFNRLAKDRNRDGRGYSFEVMRARMLYTTKHKKKSPQIKGSPFLGRATMAYSMGLPEQQKNFGVDLSTFWRD